MNKTLVTSFAAASLLAVSSFSFAAAAPHAAPAYTPPAATHWYVGVGLNYNNATTEENYSGGGSTRDADMELDNSLGYNLFVGNRLSKHWAIEGGVNYLGDREYQTKKVTYPKTTHESNWNVYLDGIFAMPVGQYFDAFVKGGVNYFMTEEKYQLDKAAKSADTGSFDSFGLNCGAGMQFNYNQFGVRAGYTHLHFAAHQESTYKTPDFVYLDVLYHFT